MKDTTDGTGKTTILNHTHVYDDRISVKFAIKEKNIDCIWRHETLMGARKWRVDTNEFNLINTKKEGGYQASEEASRQLKCTKPIRSPFAWRVYTAKINNSALSCPSCNGGSSCKYDKLFCRLQRNGPVS